MPSLLTHVAVGLLLGLACSTLRCMFTTVLLSTVQDLDILIHGLHRALLQNIYITTMLACIGACMGRTRIEKIIYATCPWTHILLDMTTGGVALFWPFTLHAYEIANIWPTIWISGLSPCWADKLGIVLILTYCIATVLKRVKTSKVIIA